MTIITRLEAPRPRSNEADGPANPADRDPVDDERPEVAAGNGIHSDEGRLSGGAAQFAADTRLIRLEEGPHLPSDIKLWNRAWRGHWEGNTLVLDTRNNNGKVLFGRYGDFMSENATVIERFIFSPDGSRSNCLATFSGRNRSGNNRPLASRAS